MSCNAASIFKNSILVGCNAFVQCSDVVLNTGLGRGLGQSGLDLDLGRS